MNEIRLPNINHVQLAGRLIKDCETKIFDNGGMIINGCMAVDDNYKSTKTNEWVARSYFFNFIVNGKQAETLKDKLKKGNAVLIEGKLQTRNYEDKSGNKRVLTEIVAFRIQKLTKKEVPHETENEEKQYSQVETNDIDINIDIDEDIPF